MGQAKGLIKQFLALSPATFSRLMSIEFNEDYLCGDALMADLIGRALEGGEGSWSMRTGTVES